MSLRDLRSIVYVLYSLITYSDALCVNTNSTCIQLCKGNQPYDKNDFSTDTYPWDIVCDDWELVGPNSTISGRKFRSCLSCERTSSIYDPSTKIGDVYWLLYNLKATITLCVFGYPDYNQTQAYNQCNDICRGDRASVQTTLVDRMEINNATLQYNYCKNGAFQKNYNACLGCLNTLPSASGLSNYLHALNEACIQQPPAGSNSTLNLDFDLFPRTANLTFNSSSVSPTAETTATVTSPQATPSANLTTPAVTTQPANRKVGIAVGVSVGLALPISAAAAILFFKHHVQRKRIQQGVEARARIEAEYDVREKHGGTAELTAPPYVAEAGGESVVEVGGVNLVEADGGHFR